MSDARTLYREAFQHFANDRLDEAIEGYKKAIEADEALSLAWNGLSLAYRNKGDLDGAIEAAKKLVELEPDDPLSHSNLSILYQSKGMIPEAEAAMAKAGELERKEKT